jgi:hypothetical protein
MCLTGTKGKSKLKAKLIIISILLLSHMPAVLYGQKSNKEDASRKLLSYMVSKAMT